MAESLTIFDYCVILAVGISGLTAMFRGFMREASTLGAFIGGVFGAFYLHSYIAGPIHSVLGPYSPDWLPTLIAGVVIFLVLYGTIAWLGATLSQNIRKLVGFGLLDNLLGLIFGIARGLLIVLLVVMVIRFFIGSENLDPRITEAVTYPSFEFYAEEFENIFGTFSNNTAPLSNP